MSSGPVLTAEQWEVCGIACYRACSNSLQELHQLTMAFSPRSESFYGDIAQVKVAARRDATTEESDRLRQLSAQVSLFFFFPTYHIIIIITNYFPSIFIFIYLDKLK